METYPENLTYDDTYEVENELTRSNYSFELNEQSIYNISIPGYYHFSI